jgi:hypothetical protein
MSLAEEEKGSVDAGRRDPENPRSLKADVSSLSTSLSLIDWLELINSVMYRVSLSMASTIPTLISLPCSLKMNLRIPRSGPLSLIQMIPRCIHLLFELGSSVSFGLSLSLVSISSFILDILPFGFPRLVFNGH